MRLLRHWLRAWLRDRRAPARPPVQGRPALEALEDRQLLSTTDLTYDVWRQQRYTLNDEHVAQSVPPASIQAVNGSFGSAIGLDRAFASYSYRGTGYAVAVIDTGIDYTHPDLGGGFGVGKRVVAGYDFVNGDADPRDDNGHGTHVAGIIGSSSATYSGVAPNVNLIALKVLDSTGSGSFGYVEDALRWVMTNRTRYNIVAVNLSLGASNYTSNPYTFLEDEFSSLKSAGVFIAAAAGNDFYGNSSQQGLSYPAISANVVSVGAVWAGNFGEVGWASGARDYTTAVDRVASFSQRSGVLGITAPGALIRSTYLNGGYQSMAGTSMATPVVAGAAVLLRQALDARGLTASATQDYLLSLMRSTGASVTDGDDENDNVTNTGLAFKRLDVAAALNGVGPVGNVAPVLHAVPEQKLRAGRPLVVTLSASDANGDALTYSARVIDGGSQAYALDQQLGLTYPGSYYTNSYGANEKWLKAASGAWYCILPNGELRRWAYTMAETLKPAALVASLGVAYYNDPALLWNAQPGAGGQVTLTVSGNRITLNAPAGTTGTFNVEAAVSDGKLTAKRTFKVTIVANTPPVLAEVAGQSVVSGTALRVTLGGSDADGDVLTYTARIVDAPAMASLGLAGNVLTVRPSAGQLGTFTVEVTASDGLATATKRFTVDVRGNWVIQASGDVNGDGKDDLVSFNAGDANWWVNLSTGTGFTLRRFAGFGYAGSWTVHAVADFNGDGKTDVASFNAEQGYWYVGTSTGTAFGVSPWARNWSAGDVWTTVQAADFTGDGRADLAAFHVSGQWWVARSTGSTLVTTLWAGNWSEGRVWQFYPGDFDGDGKRDIAAFHESGEWWVARSTGGAFTTTRWDLNWSAGDVWKFYVGDYNGDGKDDVGAFHDSGEWWVARSTGAGFGTLRWAKNWSEGNVWSFLAGDFDGDGKDDLGSFHESGEWWLARSQGAAFGTTRWGYSWASRAHWAVFLAGDYDGDGKDDVASFSTAGEWWLARSTGTSFQAARWSTARM